MKIIIGSHVSFTKDTQLLGSLDEALSYNATTFMFYTGAPQNTNRAAINDELTIKALNKMQEFNINKNNIVVHAPYIINPATIKNRAFAIDFLKQELKRVESLKMTKLVLHPGSHVGIGEDEAIKQITDALNEALEVTDNVTILLETMSKKGTEIGTIDEIKEIYKNIKKKDQIGLCLDTCHLSDAGNDITKLDDIIDEIEEKIGKNKIGCIHINDSKNEQGAKKDRHANIGEGHLGFKTLYDIVHNERLKDVPKILETPYITKEDGKQYPPYKEEIKMLVGETLE